MKVGELIEELKPLNADIEVVVNTRNGSMVRVLGARLAGRSVDGGDPTVIVERAVIMLDPQT